MNVPYKFPRYPSCGFCGTSTFCQGVELCDPEDDVTLFGHFRQPRVYGNLLEHLTYPNHLTT